MGKYIIKRLAMSVLIIFLVSVFAFSLMHILPGDPIRIALGESVSEETIAEYRAKYHLDKPILQQYGLWVEGILHGDFGKSLLYGEDVTTPIKTKLPVTMAIGIPVVLILSLIHI